MITTSKIFSDDFPAGCRVVYSEGVQIGHAIRRERNSAWELHLGFASDCYIRQASPDATAQTLIGLLGQIPSDF